MRLYAPITKIDVEQKMVGYASTECRDDQGEIVKREVLAAALPEWMKLGNIREMHQLSAVGKAKEAGMDDKGLFIGAKIIDPLAWEKVREGVYSGFSIGGRVTSRDAKDRTIIDGISLSEISVVDRPANPEALFDVWKAATPSQSGENAMPDGAIATLGETDAGKALAALKTPVQYWACGDAAHQHLQKVDAAKCMEAAASAPPDPPTGPSNGEDSPAGDDAAKAVDEEPAPPTEEEIDKVATEGAAAADELMAAAVRAVEAGDAALDAIDKTVEGEPVEAPETEMEKGPAAIERPAQASPQEPAPASTEKTSAYASDEHGIRAAWAHLGKTRTQKRLTPEKIAGIKARVADAWKASIDADGPPDEDAAQKITKALMDVGSFIRILLDLQWLKESLEVEAVLEAIIHLNLHGSAGIISELCSFINAEVAENTAELMLDDGMASYEMGDAMMMASWLDDAATTLRKVAGSAATQKLMPLLTGLFEPPVDAETDLRRAGARNNSSDRGRIQKMHDLCVEMAAKCTKADEGDIAMAAAGDDLAKVLADERVEKVKLVSTLELVVPILDRLTKTVTEQGVTLLEIRNAPFPARAIAKTVGIAVEKTQDGGLGEKQPSLEEIVEGLAKLSKDEQTMELIKLGRKRPRPYDPVKRVTL